MIWASWQRFRYNRKCLFFRAFITLRSQFHLHHHSQWALTEIVSKTLDLSFNYVYIEICIDRVNLSFKLFQANLSNILMCVLLHLLICMFCTVLRAHTIVVEVLHKLLLVNQTENGAGESILQCHGKFPQSTPWSCERHRGMQTGTGQVLDGSSTGLNTARMPADSSSKPRSGKGTRTNCSTSMRNSCQTTWESTDELASWLGCPHATVIQVFSITLEVAVSQL